MSSVSTELSKIGGQRIEFAKTSHEQNHSNFRYLGDFSRRFDLPQYIPSLVRVFSLARKLGFRGLLVDSISCEDSPLLVEENQALASEDAEYVRSDIYKFSFFKEELEDRICPDSFLGYSVLKVDRNSRGRSLCAHIFEAVLTLPRFPARNNFLQCKRRYRVTNTLGDNFEVDGALYAQQNGKTFVCAHVALRTALACIMPDGDIAYQKISQFARKRGGLQPAEMEQVFLGLQIPFDKIVFDPCQHNAACLSMPVPPYPRALYGFTESACPALLGFQLTGRDSWHIVPVIGHTFNEDSWVPPSNQGYFQTKNFRFFSSEQWLSSHIMHDDYFGPYYCLPRQFLSRENFRLLYGISLQKSALQSIYAEVHAIGFFRELAVEIKKHSFEDPWMDLFLAFESKNGLILRAVYLSKEEYLKHLQICAKKKTVPEENNFESLKTAIEPVLPEHFWMVEASMPELFSVSRKKLGEITFSLSIESNTVSINPHSARLPSYIIVRDREDSAGQKSSTLLPSWSSWRSCPFFMSGHTPVYSTNTDMDIVDYQ